MKGFQFVGTIVRGHVGNLTDLTVGKVGAQTVLLGATNQGGGMSCWRVPGADSAARLAARGGVEGFGMAGEERHGTVADYARAFAIAGDAGLGLTVHAGEMAGASSVRAALDALPVTRIGHGVRAAEDPDLVRRLAGEGVVLEACPGSKLALGLYPSLDRHPIAALRAAGVAVTVSTDDPPWWHTDMVAEYRGLAAAFGWTPADFRAINATALAAAFCDAATRSRIRERLEAACST